MWCFGAATLLWFPLSSLAVPLVIAFCFWWLYWIGQAELDREICFSCTGVIRKNATRNKCVSCSKQAHLKCSGRYRTDWECHLCNQKQSQPQPQPLELASSICNECMGKIKKAAPRATCRQCTNHFHFKCISSTRSGQKHAHSFEWNCDSCKTVADREVNRVEFRRIRSNLQLNFRRNWKPQMCLDDIALTIWL